MQSVGAKSVQFLNDKLQIVIFLHSYIEALAVRLESVHGEFIMCDQIKVSILMI